MENVAAAQLLAFLYVPEADAALVSGRALLCRSLHVLQLLQLDDELAPLDECHAFVPQRAQVVRDLAEDVNGQCAPAHDYEEETRVDYEVTRVK